MHIKTFFIEVIAENMETAEETLLELLQNSDDDNIASIAVVGNSNCSYISDSE